MTNRAVKKLSPVENSSENISSQAAQQSEQDTSHMSSVTPLPSKQPKIKTLTVSAKREIQLKNHARKLAGLSPIVIKVRKCIACGRSFESAGNRTCGCQSRKSGFIAGREIII